MANINQQFLKATLAASACSIFVLAGIFAFLNSVPVTVNTHGRNVQLLVEGLYRYNMEILSEKYPILITPAGWVFSINWPLIYFWNLLSAIYMLGSMFLSPDSNPILRARPILPPAFFVGWISTYGSIIGWLFSFDAELFELSAFLLILATISTYFCLAVSYRAIQEDEKYLQQKCKVMLILVRFLVHNGLATLSTWITCASLLNLNLTIYYKNSPDSPTAIPRDIISLEKCGVIMLSLAVIAVLSWFIIENFVYEKYCHYTLVIQPGLTFAFTGMVIANWRNSTDPISLFLCGALVLCVVVTLLRFSLFTYNQLNMKAVKPYKSPI